MSWAGAVFHVLAHVPPRLASVSVSAPAHAPAASAFDTAYVEWAAARLGPAEERTLAEDARLLAQLLADAPTLARVQLLAWLWEDAAQVAVCRDRELAACDAVDAAARDALVALGPVAEVLRAAAELELPLLPPAPPPDDAWAAALASVTPAAPTLARCRVSRVHALPRRGRVHDAHIFVGVAGVAGATHEHAAWQAAHEATVHECVGAEARALGLLRGRAVRAGLGDAHARWLATLDLRAIGPIPDVADVLA